MIKNIPTTLVLVITSMINISPWVAQSTPTIYPSVLTTPIITSPIYVSDLAVNEFTDATNYRVNLTNNLSSWNVKELISIINETNPEWFYSYHPFIIASIFPPELLRQLPIPVLEYYQLCQYLPINDRCINGSDTDNSTIDFCVVSLKRSNHRNPVSETKTGNISNSSIPIDITHCGLKCSEGRIIFNLSVNQQKALDTCKLVCIGFLLIILLYLAIQLGWEHHKSGESFANKNLMYQIPCMITGSAIVINICFVMGVGKGRTIMCNQDDDTVTFFNPKYGQNIGCTIQYIFVFGGMMSFFFYNTLLSFVIFRTVYNPMNPLWEIPKRYWHLFVNCCTLLMVFVPMYQDAVGTVYPIGVCFPGVTDKQQLLGYLVVPFVLTAALCGIFLSLSKLYLWRQLHLAKGVVTGEQSSLKELSSRLIWYSICILSTQILLTITAWQFAIRINPMYDAVQRMIFCEITAYFTNSMDPDDCQGTQQNTLFWFFCWFIACVVVILGQFILVCSKARREKLIFIKSTYDSMSNFHEHTVSFNPTATGIGPSKSAKQTKNSADLMSVGAHGSISEDPYFEVSISGDIQT